MHMLQIEGLSLSYGRQQVLNEISFSVEKGSITGLLGPNGAGKSSILKILAGLVRPDSGSVRKEGDRLGDIAKLRETSAYMIDSPAFYPYLSGLQNLHLISRLQKETPDLSEILNEVGLDPSSDKGVRNYSTGMKQRLAIAQTLLRDADLLLLDEPFNGLDPNGFQDLIVLLRKLNDQGKTVVVSSHLLNELEQFADAFILLHKGEVALDISKEELQRMKKQVTFTFDQEPSRPALKLIKSHGEYHKEEKQAVLDLKPEQIAATVESLVDHGTPPVNIETQNLLQSKYLEITI